MSTYNPLTKSEHDFVKTKKVSSILLPLYGGRVEAGFPSPADDYIEDYLDLNDRFITNPAATFIVKATGNSMVGMGIFSGDYLVVNRSIKPQNGDIVIAVVNGELTVKQLSCNSEQVQLLPANRHYKPIPITDGMELVIEGVVTLVLHEFKRCLR